MFKKLKSLLSAPPSSPTPTRHRHAAPDNGDGNRQKEPNDDMPGEFEHIFSQEESDPQSWIGVGLDGTLSKRMDHFDLQTIGDPIPEMVARIEDWITHGYTVKVFTERASVPEGIPPIKEWLKKHSLPDLEITDAKDLHMVEFWDDRAVQIIANLGQPVGKSFLEKEEKIDEPGA